MADNGETSMASVEEHLKKINEAQRNLLNVIDQADKQISHSQSSERLISVIEEQTTELVRRHVVVMREWLGSAERI